MQGSAFPSSPAGGEATPAWGQRTSGWASGRRQGEPTGQVRGYSRLRAAHFGLGLLSDAKKAYWEGGPLTSPWNMSQSGSPLGSGLGTDCHSGRTPPES